MRGVKTFGNANKGLSFQVYWPVIKIEWFKKDFKKLYPIGFWGKFANDFRFTIDVVEGYYAGGFAVFGFGFGAQYTLDIATNS